MFYQNVEKDFYLINKEKRRISCPDYLMSSAKYKNIKIKMNDLEVSQKNLETENARLKQELIESNKNFKILFAEKEAINSFMFYLADTREIVLKNKQIIMENGENIKSICKTRDYEVLEQKYIKSEAELVSIKARFDDFVEIVRENRELKQRNKILEERIKELSNDCEITQLVDKNSKRIDDLITKLDMFHIDRDCNLNYNKINKHKIPNSSEDSISSINSEQSLTEDVVEYKCSDSDENEYPLCYKKDNYEERLKKVVPSLFGYEVEFLNKKICLKMVGRELLRVFFEEVDGKYRLVESSPSVRKLFEHERGHVPSFLSSFLLAAHRTSNQIEEV